MDVFKLIFSGVGIGVGTMMTIFSLVTADQTKAFDTIVLSSSIEEINHYHNECMKSQSNIDKCFDQFDSHMLLYKVATKNSKKQGN